MKLKYYLRGLGTGILFASIVLSIAFSYRTTDSRIKEWAKELGMVYPDEKEEKSSELQSSSEEKTDEQTTGQTTTGQTTEQKEDESETTTASENKISCTITVTSGTISHDVAIQLETAGIIEDADDFDEYLCDNGYAYRIQNGTYTIIKGMKYEEIAKLITGRNY